jgi:thioredoxin 1
MKYPKILGALLTAALVLAAAPPVYALPDIYPPPAQAPADLAAALKTAAAQHQHILVDFGGNWCTDCHVLDIYMHDSTNQPILDSSYVVVHVNIGQQVKDQNLDIAKRYEVPLNKGVPALAILDSHGKLLYSQKAGEFEAMRHMESSAVTQFLLRWKARKSA